MTPKTHARRFVIVAAATTQEALDNAVEQATRLINEGNLAGKDSKDDASFYFDSTDEVPDSELPA